MTRSRNAPDYEDDFVAWLEDQAGRARRGEVEGLDLENIAEELEGMARGDRREIRNQLTVLLVHLLKYVAQPRRRSSSWLATVGEQRTQITTVIDDSPSLRSFPRRSWDSAMPKRDRGPLWRPSCPKMPFRSIVHLSCRSCSDPAGSIRVNAIRPGIVVDTAMRTSLEGQQRHWGLPQTAGREQLIP